MDNFDVQFLVALNTNYEDIRSLCQTNQVFRHICMNQYFWKQKSEKDFGIPTQVFNQTSLPPREQYLKILSQHRCVRGSEKYVPIGRCIQESAKKGHVRLMYYFLFKGNIRDYSYAFNGAGQANNYHLIQRLLMEVGNISSRSIRE